MKLIYVAGAYRAPSYQERQRNITLAREVGILLWAEGFAALVPHSNSAHMDGAAPDEAFLEGSLEMLRRCDAVVMMPGWRESEGSVAEYTEVVKLGIPAYEFPAFPSDELKQRRIA